MSLCFQHTYNLNVRAHTVFSFCQSVFGQFIIPHDRQLKSTSFKFSPLTQIILLENLFSYMEYLFYIKIGLVASKKQVFRRYSVNLRESFQLYRMYEKWRSMIKHKVSNRPTLLIRLGIGPKAFMIFRYLLQLYGYSTNDPSHSHFWPKFLFLSLQQNMFVSVFQQSS